LQVIFANSFFSHCGGLKDVVNDLILKHWCLKLLTELRVLLNEMHFIQ
jgi:hypothetical protein